MCNNYFRINLFAHVNRKENKVELNKSFLRNARKRTINFIKRISTIANPSPFRQLIRSFSRHSLALDSPSFQQNLNFCAPREDPSRTSSMVRDRNVMTGRGRIGYYQRCSTRSRQYISGPVTRRARAARTILSGSSRQSPGRIHRRYSFDWAQQSISKLDTDTRKLSKFKARRLPRTPLCETQLCWNNFSFRMYVSQRDQARGYRTKQLLMYGKKTSSKFHQFSASKIEINDGTHIVTIIIIFC